MLRERLNIIEQCKASIANVAVLSATTESEKKANQHKSMIEKYGTSCFLQLLDDEPAPAENQMEELKKDWH